MAHRKTAAARKRAVFLDRDGTINTPPKHRYIMNWGQFRFLPGVLPALRRLRRLGCAVIVISNQSGVGRGVMPKAELDRITRRMLAEVRRAGGRIDAVYYCTHHPEKGCGCRKPHPGLFKKAARRFRLDLSESTMVGDSEIDILAARSAGCRKVLVLTGRQTRASARQLTVPPDRIAKDLPDAVRWILRREGPS